MSNKKKQLLYDVIIIGGGHAGCEAALASARRGCTTLLLTMSLDNIALMPCNPAIGGIAKGHIVREIDALGGQMAKCIDSAGIQFRMLNTSKGPAVQALRAQADKHLYRLNMKEALENQQGLSIKQAVVDEIIVEKYQVRGVKTEVGKSYYGTAVIICSGTFLNGIIHIGLKSFSAGRAGEFSSICLSESLKKLGFNIGRLKTGTCPRLDKKTIDFSCLLAQFGDTPPIPFSYATKAIIQQQVPCYITHTNQLTHKIIKDNLEKSPLYSGKITGTGPRYCPSIEDKIVRFPDRDKHQVFLEPEGLHTNEIYANGISTSMPVDVQSDFLRTIKGLEKVEIMRAGYAVEYDFVLPTQLLPTLETKSIKNLFHAGQINGTSGYEEAAAQGLIAGINASSSVMEKEQLVLQRSDAYIGVLIDDLVTKGTLEPYRMFTSRAEYRLLLRQDNADLRLFEKGYSLGLLAPSIFNKFIQKKTDIKEGLELLKNTIITPQHKVNSFLECSEIGCINTATSLAELLKRPNVRYDDISYFLKENDFACEVTKQIEIQIKYEGYINRQLNQVKKFKQLEKKKIPAGLEYRKISGLSTEVVEKLSVVKPTSLGQASRISGVTPSAISMILIFLEKKISP